MSITKAQWFYFKMLMTFYILRNPPFAQQTNEVIPL